MKQQINFILNIGAVFILGGLCVVLRCYEHARKKRKMERNVQKL